RNPRPPRQTLPSDQKKPPEHRPTLKPKSGTVTGNSPGSWKTGARAAFRTCRAMPHRRHSHDRQVLPGRRPRATVTPGSDAPAGTCAPGRVCRDGRHDDILMSSWAPSRQTATFGESFRTMNGVRGRAWTGGGHFGAEEPRTTRRQGTVCTPYVGSPL